MDLEIPDRPAGTWTKTTFSRLAKPQQTCIFWQRGRCNRKPCNFLHVEEPGKGIGANNGFAPKRSLHMQKDTQAIVTDDSQPKVPDVTFLAQLVGHEKAVQGIVLPKNSDKLYSGGQDETVRIWDCKTGQCINAIKLGAEIGCLLSEGPWIFVGIPNVVKVWNTVTSTELNLDGPKGPVHTLVVGNGLLLAGISDGNILTWKFIPASNSFEPAASLSGHTMPVVTLVSGVDRLYSGSMDHTIRVWDLATFQCLQTLEGHTSAVMSLLLWEQFLLSSSLDNTIKVWGAMSSGLLKVNYTHNEEHGVLALCGMHDEQAKPVLICSRNDKFSERGKIFTRMAVRAFQVGPGGLFITGDGMGDLKVWKWATKEAS